VRGLADVRPQRRELAVEGVGDVDVAVGDAAGAAHHPHLLDGPGLVALGRQLQVAKGLRASG
jgi:hypothetical protein